MDDQEGWCRSCWRGGDWSRLVRSEAVIAAKTERLGLATGVTCPTVRCYPMVIAQAAATLALVSEGRFTLGSGPGSG